MGAHWPRAETDPIAESHLVSKSDKRFAGRCGAIGGYGSSLPFGEGHITIPSDRWTTKLKTALGALTDRNYAVGGSKLLVNQNTSGWAQIWQHKADRLPTPSGSFLAGDVRPPGQGVIYLEHGINDLGSYGTSQPNFQTAFAKTLEAVTRMFRAGYVWRSSSVQFTKTGWSNASSTAFGGDYHTRTTPGTITFATMGAFPGGTMTFYIAVRQDANEYSRCQVSIDGGAVVTTVDTNGMGINGQWIVVPIVVQNVPAGNGHTVTLTFDSVGVGGVGRFLGGTLASAWPPMVLLVGQPATPTMPPASEPQMTQGALDGVNASHAAVAAMFTDGKVLYVDLTSMNGDPTYWQDDVHYNPKGHAQIADLCLTALANAGGVPAGFAAGPVNTFTGPPDWSAAPGTESTIDPATGIVYYPNSLIAGDWKGLQPLDTDLTAFAALVPANDDVIQRKAGVWTNRTMAQLIIDLAALGTTFQPLDPELSALAALASAADKLPYFTGAGTAALATLSTFIRTLIDDADAATARATLGAAPAISTATNILGGDVTMTNANQFYDGPSVSLTAGTWLVIATVHVDDSSANTKSWAAKLWDGTTVAASGATSQRPNAGEHAQITLSAIVTPGSTTTYKISAASIIAGTSKIKAANVNNGSGNNASQINAIRIA